MSDPKRPTGFVSLKSIKQGPPDPTAALAEGGVDLFVLETFRDLNEIGAAIDAVRSVSDVPIVAQMTTEEDGNHAVTASMRRGGMSRTAG